MTTATRKMERQPSQPIRAPPQEQTRDLTHCRDRGVDPHGSAPFLLREDCGDLGHDVGQHQGAAQPLQGPEGEERRQVGGQGAQHRTQRKQGDANDGHRLAAPTVCQAAGEQQGDRQGGEVSDQDPLDFVDAHAEVARHRGQRQGDEEAIHVDHEVAALDRREHPPAVGRSLRGLAEACGKPARHRMAL
jgi:hypothetical protein